MEMRAHAQCSHINEAQKIESNERHPSNNTLQSPNHHSIVWSHTCQLHYRHMRVLPMGGALNRTKHTLPFLPVLSSVCQIHISPVPTPSRTIVHTNLPELPQSLQPADHFGPLNPPTSSHHIHRLPQLLHIDRSLPPRRAPSGESAVSLTHESAMRKTSA